MIVADFSKRLPGPNATAWLAQNNIIVYRCENKNFPDPFFNNNEEPLFHYWFTKFSEQKLTCSYDEQNKNELVKILNKADIILGNFPKHSYEAALIAEVKKTKPKGVHIIPKASKEFYHLHEINAMAKSGLLAESLKLSDNLPFLPLGGILFAREITEQILLQYINSLEQNIWIEKEIYLDDVLSQNHNTFIGDYSSPFLHNGKYPCYQLYELKDRKILVFGAIEAKFWDKIMLLLNLPYTSEHRFDNTEAIKNELRQFFAKIDSNQLSSILPLDELCLDII